MDVGCNIKKDLKQIVRQSVEWINLAQDGKQWRVLSKTVINIGLRRSATISI
jgi:hypothetical protein